MTKAVKKACDACHRRKVKRDGISPCRACYTAQLSCTYNAIPQKKGPKGSPAKVLSELRETQRQTSLSAKVQNRLNGIPCATVNARINLTSGLLTTELIKSCVSFFFANLYPQLPILEQRQIEQQMMFMEQNRDAYLLMTSFCAFIILQPGMTMPQGDPYNLDMNPGATIILSQLLLEECLRVRKGYSYHDSVNLNVLATNFFIFGCYYGLEQHEKAWYYLREAATMIHMAGMDKEGHYMKMDGAEATRRRRLFWLLLVIERAYAIQRQRPLTLQATIHSPCMGDDPTDAMVPELSNFFALVNLYRPFDDAFMATWKKACHHLGAPHITSLQKQLHDITQAYPVQESDYAVNQQWLKFTLWQLTNGSIGGNGEDSRSFQYPINMSRELLMNMVAHFPNQGMEFIGSTLIVKLLETCLAMTEVLANQPQTRDPFAVGPRQYLNQLLNILNVTRNGDYRFLPLLLSKVTEIIPRAANPMLQNAPDNSQLRMASMDIFDGFGTAGIAQMPVDKYNQNPPLDDYETKYQLDLGDNMPDSIPNSNASNGTPPGTQPGNEMNTSFVSSSSVMSPGMEYPHNMDGFNCTPMSDMVMSP
ncbi:hypothetical protein FOMG_02398 [Fusarium oxysporum f. sp. melonis 26406]|uniref:Zn(2)-C6 fungal-type domain-containing protein n=1 Tax=Fusarium oxysporum f. sp. melonis 26406 TaxID=1089452 RepID=X0BEB1_FUSOX|nr:hypothetical protein FOMG_02398 [Fusarium oxysporum f. sp. melonis 26406]